jgi:pilus assembly protein CpaB
VTASLTVATGAGSAFAAAIRPGWRAISIAVGPAAGLAGFVAPGDRVDVLLTHSVGNRRTAQTLIADLGVLGVDQRQRGDAGGPLASANDIVASANSGAAPPDLVTLEVTPQQAEALTVAAELGKLSLVLRGPGREAARVGGRRWDSDVTGLPPALLAAGGSTAAVPPPSPVAAVAAPAPTGGVEIVYGLPPAAAPPPAEAVK